MKAPFPYFGGKATIAAVVWAALGDVKHYIEPFFGSGAVLLARPDYRQGVHVETINDSDGFIANVWRALAGDPDEVAKWCDWPVNHADLMARKARLLANEPAMLESLAADDVWYDAKMAGYWIWAASCWIGSGMTCLAQRPHVCHGGKGVHAIGQRPHVCHGGKGVHRLSLRGVHNANIYEWFRALSERLRYVRVVCGDWTRVCGGNWQDGMGTCGMFFDPPYGVEDRDTNVYGKHDSTTVASDVEAWVRPRGLLPSYRIVVAGYDGEYKTLEADGWRIVPWKAGGGYGKLGKLGGPDGNTNTRGMDNRHRERLWLSPHCEHRDDPQGDLFAGDAEVEPCDNGG